MQMLQKLIKFVILFVILFVVTECLSVLQFKNSLNNAITFPSRELTCSVSKIVNGQKENLQHVTQTFPKASNEDDADEENDENEKFIKKDQKRNLSRQGPKIWDQWGNWSSCSVTCGIGKLTRWRHCIGGSCLLGEKKAQLKTCTLAAC